MNTEQQVKNYDVLHSYLSQHGRSLTDRGISRPGVGLDADKATKFIQLLEATQIPLYAIEVWRFSREERGRYSYDQNSSWPGTSPEDQDYGDALAALARAALGPVDLVAFTFGIARTRTAAL